jgi:2-oxoglutarate ferredoxin oxidoreductase subunit gamma
MSESAVGPLTGAAAAPTATPTTASARLLAGRDFVEVRFGGSGGQGVILMGVILAVAATRDHRHVIQTQSYGPEARGGYSRSDVIISSLPVDYPQLLGIDLLVALSAEAVHRYSGMLRRSGVFIFDADEVPDPQPVSCPGYGVPFTRLAREVTGRAQTANILTLGAVVGLTGVVSAASLEQSVLGMVPAGTEEPNLTALHRGLGLQTDEWRVIPQA